jgi:peptide/nickel transport system ATP-binding protein
MTMPLIDIRNLSVGFTSQSGEVRPILRNIDISIRKGETLGLVGESGSGKSTLALAMMGYLKSGLSVIAGEASFRARDTFNLNMRMLESIRGGELALIPQNAGRSLTPSMRIGAQLMEALRLHSSLPISEHSARVLSLLGLVRLPDPRVLIDRYPHELSGGQQQRVAIAMALAGEPDALILDEPTTALDVTTQAHVLELLRDLALSTGTAMVYVSHDLGAIARVCDRVAVMYAGEIMLVGTTRQVLQNPIHPYARGLLASIPKLREARLPVALEGWPPAPGNVGTGCSFRDRCALAQQQCFDQRPSLQTVQHDQMVRCYRHDVLMDEPDCIAVPRTRSIDIDAHPALDIQDVSISYAKPGFMDQVLGRDSKVTPTVAGISVTIRKGETIGLVGESGSGKSTILKAIAGLQPLRDGAFIYGEAGPLAAKVEQRKAEQLRGIQLIFQNPDESLNPRHTIEQILEQPLRRYFNLTGDALRARTVELLERVRLGANYLDRYPSQLSGGEKQRVAISRAFAAQPDMVLCDEVTSALDVSVQAAVLDLLDELRRDAGTTYIFVSHDLAVVRALSDRVAVLYQGRLCEIGPVEQVYGAPYHPYTEILLGAVLEPDPDVVPQLTADDVVELSPPDRGCPFQRRCPKTLGSICDTQAPPWHETPAGNMICCHRPLEELM